MTDETTNSQNPSSELEIIKAELEAMTETAKRALADLANFKRHAEEERKDLHVYANQKFLEAIFPTLDNFKRAFENTPEELKENTWVKGLESVEAGFFQTLERLGLSIIEATDVPVNPHEHEVLMQGEGAKDQVIQIFEKGYKFNGLVLRPAKVMVGSGQQSEN